MKKTKTKTKSAKATAKKKSTPSGSKKTAAPKAPKAPKAVLSNDKIGILGGAFNPIHAGHLNSAMTVRDRLKLDRVIFVPAFQAPHREVVGPNPEDRLALVKVAVNTYSPELEVSEMEYKRGGTSYTYLTLEELQKTFRPENMYFIMGADAFAHFPEWKNFEKLLQLANFVVTTRPGSEVKFTKDMVPEGLKKWIKSSTADKLVLKTGRNIVRVGLDDIDISSTEIRKRLRNGQSAQKWLPPKVVDMINDKGLYKRSSPLVSDYREFSLFCGRQLLDKKALDLKIYDMTKKNSYADYSVVVSATSSRHASALAESVLQTVKEEYGLTPISVEGLREGLWSLLDFGAVVVHVFQDAVRQQYQIEDLWKDCPQIQREADPRLGARNENQLRHGQL